MYNINALGGRRWDKTLKAVYPLFAFMGEVWKDIEGFEGVYEISSLGNIRRLYHGKFRYTKPCLNKKRKYFYINCEHKQKRKNFIFHRILAITFCQIH